MWCYTNKSKTENVHLKASSITTDLVWVYDLHCNSRGDSCVLVLTQLTIKQLSWVLIVR